MINKETLEKILGYEIHDFKIERVYFEDKLVELNIKIQPKQKIKFIDFDFKILPTSYIMNKEEAKDQLIELLEKQIEQLTMMSKIELGDDVIEEIIRIKSIINEQPR